MRDQGRVKFLVILAWILMVGADDLKAMPLTFLLGATVLTVSAVLVGSVLSPGPMRLRTTAGAHTSDVPWWLQLPFPPPDLPDASHVAA